jgi:methylenetetrahydrofolate reductase (NADPH)
MRSLPDFVSTITSNERTSLSFEFFPPKTPEGRITLEASIAELLKHSPDFVSVTYGAMGSNQETSLEVVESLASRVPTIAHLTCIGSKRDQIVQLLGRYESSGVAGLLALRGDLPAGHDVTPASDFTYALELLELAKEHSELQLGVAAFPEKHPESVSLEFDMEILKRKAELGAEFAMTQLFFENHAFERLRDRALASGVDIPIVAGVMPIANSKQVLRMAQMSGAAVPADLVSALDNASSESDAREIGMEFTMNQVEALVDAEVPGIHIFTLNHHVAASELVAGTRLSSR